METKKKAVLNAAIGMIVMMLIPLASSAMSNNDIASIAIGYEGQYGDQCKEFVRTVIQDAGGGTIGSGYRNCYGDTEIQPSQAMWGDIIQTCNDSDSDKYYPGTHSAIVLENKGDNNFKVVDSNWNITPDGIVRIGDRNLFSWASKKGTQTHYYRLGTTDHWDFNISTYTQGWKVINEESFSVGDGRFLVDPEEIDPYIWINGLLLNADSYNAIEMNMSSNCPDGNATVYFKTESSPEYSEDKTVEFKVNTGDQWDDYTIYMANHNLWNGTITGIRINPAEKGKPGETGNDTFGFDWIKVIKTDEKPYIVDCDLEYFPMTNSIIFEYWINNPYANDFEVKLGAQIRTNDPQGEWDDDWDNDKIIVLSSGTYPGMCQDSERFERSFGPLMNVEEESYDAHWVIMNNKTGEGYDDKEEMNAFVIEESSLQGKLDLIFLFDTTGSMGDDIENVQDSANEILDSLDSKDVDYRVAVADYKDYGEYTYKLNLPFTTGDYKQDIINAINGLWASGGGNWRESVYSALVEAMLDANKDSVGNPDNYGWRNGVSKAIILMGDAPPHIPEPWEGGYSLEDVSYWSENIDPIVVYSIVVGSNNETNDAFSEISEATGGKTYSAQTASDVADAIIEAIGDIGTEELPDIYVPDNHSTIQSAVNAANESDVILVREGTYQEEYIDVNKRLTLITEGEVIVEGFSNGAFVFKITADYVNMTGFKITGENNYAGINMFSDNSKIENVTILNSGSAGIRLCDTSRNSTIKDCLINSGSGNGNGLYFYRSEGNIITGNIIENNYKGIYMLSSPNNEISGNNITNSGKRGICASYSPGLTITGNNINDNKQGIYMVKSHNSNLYHNNFLGNTKNAYEYATETPKSSWDNGEEGNYWNTYTGVDNNSDGIGDTPYTYGQITDNYPLMEIWEE